MSTKIYDKPQCFDVFEGEHEALRKETVVAEKFATY
jgi:hypothetical protein